MAPGLSPNFVLPGRPNAIPIVDPRTSRRLSPDVAARTSPVNPSPIGSASSDTSGDARSKPKNPATKNGNGKTSPPGLKSKSEPQSKPKSKAAGAVATEEAASDTQEDEFERGFDVFATPFVPEGFKIVNRLKGEICHTEPVKRINFGNYVTRSLDTSLLPPIEPAAESTATGQDLTLVPKRYELFFRHHLEKEIRFQQQENDSYSLYNYQGVVEFSSNDGSQCTIIVPGLRENSPYVEQDDLVEIRQLRSKHEMNLAKKEVRKFLLKTHPSHPWTGMVFRARVSAVVRPKDTLVLQVAGLTIRSSESLLGHPPHLQLPSTRNLKLNVQFPVPMERYLPMEHVLTQIQASLTAANNIICNIHGVHKEGVDQGVQQNQFWIQSMLFPTEADSDVQVNLHSGHFGPSFDTAINWEQKKAVENICSQNYGVLPYLISGPPGTGKTKTLIETALQLIRNVDKVSHILICAPSEPASDTLALRLKSHMGPQELLRLNRSTRDFSEVPDALLPYCHIAQDMFSMPPFAQLMTYKIVVCSCRDASMLMYGRMTNTDLYSVEYGLRSRIHPFEPKPPEVKLHWDALLIDEAAQSKEPEALVPLYVVAPPPESPQLAFTPLVVMAGDEHQLGPRTANPCTPLQRSLFARLFARPVYADHPLARGKTGKEPPPLSKSMLPILRPAFTNLIRNYRSHPAILAVPSSLFYFDTLEPEAADTGRLSSWDGWRGRRWPVLFHDNRSPDNLERDAGGWYNVGEAALACGYAAALVSSGLVNPQEICIMSPFKAQVNRLRKTIRSADYELWDVNIGPTEAFQGLEHGVVILCVTRSRRRFVEKDKALGWGIIGTPNKMNVALTRAKFGLIIIGRRDVLVDDPNWAAVLEFCDRNGLVAGEEGDEADGGDREINGSGAVGKLTRIEKVLTAMDSGQDTSRVLGALGNKHHERDAW